MAELDTELVVRGLTATDLDEVVRIDGEHTGLQKPEYWRRVLDRYLGRPDPQQAFGLAIDESPGAIAGYLFGEVRAVEFGADPAGWVFAIGVDHNSLRQGVASALLREARRRFAGLGIRHARTMVRRNDVATLSFFRALGFVGGPFVQLELDLEETS